ncbi:MAG: cell surface protein SprA, partial [Bacteroidota bacterium]
YQNRKDDEVLYMKLLKSSTIRNNVSNPMWDLMMKNVYSLNTNSLTKQGFQLRVIYKDDQTGFDNPNLQEGINTKDKPLIKILGLDRLNQLLDPQPDGNFDFIENTTVDTRFGKIIFPVLEPFGATLEKNFVKGTEDALIDKYVFHDLYRKTLADAQQQTRKNKFFLKGNMQGGGGPNGASGGGAPIQLPFGVDGSTVVVSAGGVPLSAGTDYIVEEGMGQLRILNQSIMSSGREIRIDYERPDLFSNQIRTMLGGRFDYNLSKDVHLGATVMKYKETPSGFLTRVAVGNEPTNNTIIGFDAGIKKESKFLTKMIDKLPLLQTKEVSQFDFTGEYAQLFPGVAPRVNGNSFIDDFEGSRTVYDLARQALKWKLAATPDTFKVNPLDPLDIRNSYRKAKISAYNVDMTFYGVGGGLGLDAPSNFDDKDDDNVYERRISPQDIFKGKDIQNINFPVSVFDVSYFPHERGAYNYNTDLDPNGLLKNPKTNFGAVTRAIPSDIDFDNANIEILEFWLMDPFHQGPNGVVKDGIFNKNNQTGGKLEIHLGDISEDIIPDSRFNFENGLPLEENPQVLIDKVAISPWGYATKQQFITNAFDNREGSREKQDIGLDGLNSTQENDFFKTSFLDKLPTNLLPEVKAKILADPSGDDYKFYFNPDFNETTDPNKKLVFRYKDALGMENNSPPSTNTGRIALSESGTNLPDMEDLNTDNTVNDIEAFYKYEIDLKPGRLAVGSGYVVDKVDNGEGGTWYLMRVPIRTGNKVGNINGFKSIRFARILLTDFEQPVVLRFGQLQLTSFQYRKYIKDLSINEKPGLEIDEPNAASTIFKVSTVSIEENQTGNGVNVPYRVPPGFQRDRDITTFNNVQLNEQSLSLCVDNLKAGDSRAVFKNTGFDFLSYNNLRLFLHLDSKSGSGGIDGKVNAFVRIGTDLSENYYEVEKVGLISSRPNQNPTSEEVWLEQNNIDISFSDLRNLKVERDKNPLNKLNQKFTITIQNASGNYRLTVVGRPDLSSVQTMMLGVRNPSTSNEDLSFCVWMNELRVNGFNQTAGYAAIGKMNLKLADFAQVTLTGSIKTFGFGAVQQRISERNRDIRTEFGMASNIALEKLFPLNWGLQIPLFISYDKALITPKFDPLDPDMYLEDVLARRGESYRQLTDDNTIRKGFNFANVRKVRGGGQADKNHLYDIENFSLSYAYNEMNRYSVLIKDYNMRTYRGGLAYTYQNTPGIWEPFKNAKNMNRPSLAPIKDFNLSLAPNSITVRADMDRSFVKTQLRNSDFTTEGQEALFEKYWLFNRLYDINWNLSKSLVLNYNANANAIIDEPFGEVRNNETALDSIRRNIWNFGRPKLFNQNITSTWRVPLDKFPLFDWMTADYSWKVGANYQAGTFGIKDDSRELYGNVVRNNRDQQVTGKIDFVALYNKLKYLKFANSPDAKRVIITQNPGSMEDIPVSSSKVLKKFTRVLMAIRGINYTIALQEATVLPGFLPQPKYFGLGDTYLDSLTTRKVSTLAPGLPFILGSQNINILNKAENNNWLTKSKEQNLPFTQTRTKRVEFRTQIEPLKDLQIQLEARWNRTDNYQEFFRPDSTGPGFKSITPVRSGNFTMSYLSFLTAFKLTNKDGSSDNFNTFLKYRTDILNRLKSINGSAAEYNLNSQDVLLPAFFAAYSGKDVNKVKLTPFRGIPLPNWRLNYKGLANLPLFSKWFTTLELSHAYSSSYSVGNFVSSLEYQDPALLRFNQDNSRVHFLGFDTNFNYPFATQFNSVNQSVPVFMMSIISFTEKFGPFIGLNFRTKSKWTGRVEYNQDRNISLNLSNSSISELINKDWVVTLGATKNNVRIPFKVNGKTVRLKNDMTFNVNFTLRDQRATLRKIDAESVPTAGQLMLQFRPQIQYAVDKKLSLSVYFDRMLNNPYVLTSFRRATTQGGIQIRYSLTP